MRDRKKQNRTTAYISDGAKRAAQVYILHFLPFGKIDGV